MKHILSKSKTALAVGLIAALQLTPQAANAQSGTEYIGQMSNFGFNFCPRGWAAADGQLLAISQNTALFSILGTIYGGDGRTTFALPDMRGRRVIGEGTGPGLSPVPRGQKSGTESFVLTEANLPPHNHAVNGTNARADKNGPGGDYLAIPNVNHDLYHNGPPNQVMDPGMIGNTGGNLAVNKTSPALGTNWCVALFGVFPSRS